MTLTPEVLADLNKVLDYVIDSEYNHYLETVDSHEGEMAKNHIYTIAKRVVNALNEQE